MKYIFECTECGKTYSTLGGLHSHAEKHRSILSLPGNTKSLMNYTKVLEIKETEEVDIDEVEGVPSRNGFVDYCAGLLYLKS